MDLHRIVENVLLGHKDEFRHLIRECNQALYRTAVVMLKNETDAEDAMQATYLKAYLHLRAFRRESSFQTWITSILVNECRMMLRSKKKMIQIEDEEVRKTQSLTESVMETIHKKQIRELLEHAVMELPEKYRLVYIIREVNDLSTEKAAEVLGITSENVKVRLHRAKTLIREHLLQQVNVQEIFPFGNERCDGLTKKVMITIAGMPASSAVC